MVHYVDLATLGRLLKWARSHGLKITCTTGGKHNRGSKHPIGHAIDVSAHGLTDEEITYLEEDARLHGFRVLDERHRLPHEIVWGGPHLHIETQG